MKLPDLDPGLRATVSQHDARRKSMNVAGDIQDVRETSILGDTRLTTGPKGKITIQQEGSPLIEVTRPRSIGSKIRGLRSLSNL